jgi:hypothetical protein
MTIAFLPYPTGLFGEALQQGQGERTAAVLYSTTMAVNACAWAAFWLYVSTGRRLLGPEFPEAQRRRTTVLFTSGVPVYVATVGVAFINAAACLALHAALAMYYAADPLARRVLPTGTGERGDGPNAS